MNLPMASPVRGCTSDAVAPRKKSYGTRLNGLIGFDRGRRASAGRDQTI
jgi:hypothetical protein